MNKNGIDDKDGFRPSPVSQSLPVLIRNEIRAEFGRSRNVEENDDGSVLRIKPQDQLIGRPKCGDLAAPYMDPCLVNGFAMHH